ncbi:MAG: flavin reductase family protein [Gemmatimonadota bacterium]
MAEPSQEHATIVLGELRARDRYRLLTSLVVPRPIAWASTWSADGTPNLAPFSYFAALSSTPALVGISVGARGGVPKDTLENARETGALCVNVVTERQFEAMNATSAEVGREVDEFLLAGLEARPSSRVRAPYVAGCPAVLECEVRQETVLHGSSNVLLIAEIMGVLLAQELLPDEGYAVDPGRLAPVGRLGGEGYMMPGAFRFIPRP